MKTSVVDAITPKHGRQGDLVFVRVRHDITNSAGAPVLRELQDIVYRELPRPDAPVTPPSPPTRAAQWQHSITPDPVLLFRYSALSYNGHRIHYDREWAREEGYRNLVVHGPLTATLLLQAAKDDVAENHVSALSFRGLAPLVCGETIQLCGSAEGQSVELWACGPDSGVAMTVSLRLER